MDINNIIKLLDLKCSNIKITDVKIKKGVKEVYLEQILTPKFCPFCMYRMHSKGIHTRTINHPVLQGNMALKLILKQRRWKCTNCECGYTTNDEYTFVSKHKRNSNMSDFLILEAFKDPQLSISQIAENFNVSDTYALNTFRRYVDMKRRQLTEVICVDEVFVNITRHNKYALIIQDFASGEPIDFLPSRRKEVTQPYFNSIPRGERDNVKYLVSDMYRPYATYLKDYFKNATQVIDAFHVISLINRKFESYIISVQRKISSRDTKRHYELEQKLGRRIEFVHSKEYYLLKNLRWTLLTSEKNLRSSGWRYDSKLKREMSLYDYQMELYKIDPKFKHMHALKDRYIRFNDKYTGNPNKAKLALRGIISDYRASGFSEFEDVARSLEEHFDSIINSFILVEKVNKKTGQIYDIRLSNGPIESINRVVKDMKRHARGYKNFDNFRNRFLYATRKNAPVLAVPKSYDDITRSGYNTREKAKCYPIRNQKLRVRKYKYKKHWRIRRNRSR